MNGSSPYVGYVHKDIKVCGIDPHKRMCHAVILNISHRGSTVKSDFRFDNNLTGALELINVLKASSCHTVVIENSNNFAYALYAMLQDAKFSVTLVGPARIPAKNKKSDRVDAEWLALMYAKGLVTPDYVPPREIRQLRDMLRLRQLLVRERTMLKNNIHANLTRGQFDISKIVSDAFGKGGFKILETLMLASSGGHVGSYDKAVLSLPDKIIEKYKTVVSNSFIALINKVTLGVATDVIRVLNSRIKELEDTIANYIYEHEELQRNVELIMSIPGVGLITAATIVAEVGDFTRFESKKEIAAWAGMVPNTEVSNGKQVSHGLTKRGSPHIRRVLCEAANVIALHGKPEGLFRYYRRILRRKGRKIAIVALGHKLLRVIYKIVMSGEKYRDEMTLSVKKGKGSVDTEPRDCQNGGIYEGMHQKKLRMLRRRAISGKGVIGTYRDWEIWKMRGNEGREGERETT